MIVFQKYLMKTDITPNKIYVHPSPHLGMLSATSIKVDAPGEQEYIRKSALLELLLSLEARYRVFYLEGKIVRDVINRIDSL